MTRVGRSSGPAYPIVIAIALLCLAGCRGERSRESRATGGQPPPEIHLALRKFISNAPLMIAHDEGYFRDEGLDVQIVPGMQATGSIQSLVAGDVDVEATIVSTALFTAILRGGNVRLVADKGFLDPDSCTANALVARAELVDSGALDNPAGLRGLRVGYDTFGEFEYLTERIARMQGMALSDFERVPAPLYTTIEDLEHGTADLRYASEPILTRVIETGVGKVWLPLERVAPGFSLAFIIFGPRILAQPDLGTRFMRAYLRGVARAREGATDRNVAIVAKWTDLDEPLVRKACWTSWSADGSADLDGLDDFARWAWDKRYIDAPIDHTKLWDGRFIEAARGTP